jgi:hypothetical protein
MHEDERRAAAALEVVQPDAVDVKETATQAVRSLRDAGSDVDECGGAERAGQESEEGVTAAHGERHANPIPKELLFAQRNGRPRCRPAY